MKSSSTVTAEWVGGRTALSELRSEPPLTIRPTRLGVALVGSAAGPVGGDELSLVVNVGEGATLVVEAVAATMVFPGARGQTSRQDTVIRIGPSAHLDWLAQPLLSVAASNHVHNVTIDLAPTATLNYHEHVALGRTGESSGRLDTRLRVTRGGVAVMHQHQLYDPTSPTFSTTVGLGGFRRIDQHLVVGPLANPAKTSTSLTGVEMTTPLADDIELTVALSHPQRSG